MFISFVKSQQQAYEAEPPDDPQRSFGVAGVLAPGDIPSRGLDFILPLLDDSSSQVKLTVAQFLAFAVRLQQHSLAVTEWLPPEERWKQHKTKRGWENPALVDAGAPSRLGGWVVRHLSGMLKSKEFRVCSGLFPRSSLRQLTSSLVERSSFICYFSSSQE